MGAFELSVDIYCIKLGKINEGIGFIFTSQVIGHGRKIDAYIALVRYLGGTRFLKELEKFSKDSIGLAERRNRVIHDFWGFKDGSPLRFEVTARKILKAQSINVSTKELSLLPRDIIKHMASFDSLHARIMESPLTIPETLPEK